MIELRTQAQKNLWMSDKTRIGYISCHDTLIEKNNIWVMELYQDRDGHYSLLIILDSDESEYVYDFGE